MPLDMKFVTDVRSGNIEMVILHLNNFSLNHAIVCGTVKGFLMYETLLKIPEVEGFDKEQWCIDQNSKILGRGFYLLPGLDILQSKYHHLCLGLQA
jgi:hypothetical protein